MKLIYIAHPLTSAGKVEKNLQIVEQIANWYASVEGILPITPHRVIAYLDGCSLDGDQSKAKRFATELMKRCDGVHFYGEWAVSHGCLAEYNCAKLEKKKIEMFDCYPWEAGARDIRTFAQS